MIYAKTYCTAQLNDDIIPQSLEEVEKDHIKQVLEFTNKNRSKAAEILHISRVNLISKIKKYKIDK